MPALKTCAPGGGWEMRKSFAGFVCRKTLPGAFSTMAGLPMSNTSLKPKLTPTEQLQVAVGWAQHPDPDLRSVGFRVLARSQGNDVDRVLADLATNGASADIRADARRWIGDRRERTSQ